MTEYSELEKELRKASDEGDADASYRLAVLMRDGAEGIPGGLLSPRCSSGRHRT